MADVEALRALAESRGQGHLFAGWESLGSEEQDRLLSQVAEVDFDLVDAQRSLLGAEASAGATRFEPPQLFGLGRDAAQEAAAAEAAAQGAEELASGRVAFLLVAGGQASRLGYDGPKGAFPVGPVSGRSLFEFHARRLLAAWRSRPSRPSWSASTRSSPIRSPPCATRRLLPTAPSAPRLARMRSQRT